MAQLVLDLINRNPETVASLGSFFSASFSRSSAPDSKLWSQPVEKQRVRRCTPAHHPNPATLLFPGAGIGVTCTRLYITIINEFVDRAAVPPGTAHQPHPRPDRREGERREFIIIVSSLWCNHTARRIIGQNHWFRIELGSRRPRSALEEIQENDG